MSDRRNSNIVLPRLLRIGTVVVFAVVVVITVLWWQDRPLGQAEALLQDGHPAEALESLDSFLARQPAHQGAILLKARALVALQRWEEANELFDLTGAGTPDELRAWSMALLHQRRWSDGLPVLQRLASIEPKNAVTLRDLTICRYQLGQANEALASAAELASLPGHEIEGLFQRGVIHRSLSNTDLAIESWEQIEARTSDGSGLAVQPAEFFRVYAVDLMAVARPRLAASYFQRSLGIQPNAEVQVELGMAYYRVGKEREATQAWTAVLEVDEHNHDARVGLAEMALGHGDAEKALGWLAPIATQPPTPAVAYLLQRAHTLLGNEEQAEQWQEKVAMLRKSEKLRAALGARSNEDAG